jgi:hypothetical protein
MERVEPQPESSDRLRDEDLWADIPPVLAPAPDNLSEELPRGKVRAE